MKKVRIGSRGSALALWQAHHVRDLIEAQGHPTELTIIKTKGDRIDDVPFSKMEGKGFFTKELEDAQLADEVDIAVHSMKDMTTVSPPGLVLGAMIGREDARDLLLAKPDAIAASGHLPLKPGARLGTSSARRQGLVRHLARGIELVDLRGNVPTRIQKLRDGHYDAIILANAGVIRLGLDVSDLATVPLDPEHFVPAPAQGMLAIQCREEPWLMALLSTLHSTEPARCVAAERWLLAKLEGGCQLPFGAHLRPLGSAFALDTFLELRGEAYTLHFEGPDPMALAEAAWQSIAPVRAARS